MKLLLLVGCAVLVGACADPSSEETSTAGAELAVDRVFGVVATALPARDFGNGLECVSLVVVEPRGRSVAYVSKPAGGACTLLPFTQGAAFSVSNAETAAYASAPATAAIRAALGQPLVTVRQLAGSARSESAARAAVDAFLARPAPEKFAALAAEGLRSLQLDTRFDFQGEAKVSAQAAYDDVLATGSCENPGRPKVEAKIKDGFVIGYVASNQGSCHSGWFELTHGYDRNWVPVGRREYSE